MANEISLDISFSANKGGASVSFANRKYFNMTGVHMFQGTQLISSTIPEELDVGSVSSARTLIIKNLDTTNPVYIGNDGMFDSWTIIVRPNDSCVISPSGGVVYAQAATAPCLVQLVAVEED